MTILPLAYLPSVEWFSLLKRGDAVIDLGEHFIKRSERNRARILSANGEMELTVQLSHANRPRTPMRDLRLDYSKRWQHQHWGALVASYKASPYFDYYAEQLHPFYEKQWTFLVDYNMELLEKLCHAASLPLPRISEEYLLAQEGDLDFRPKTKQGSPFRAEPYIQVFSDRMPFAPNLSFVDLLFAEGPAAAGVLTASLHKE